MEQNHALWVALSVGVGVGLSLGMALQKLIAMESSEISEKQLLMELMNQVIDEKEIKVTFDEFPFYLSEGIRILLTRAGYVHLGQKLLSKHMRALTPVSRAILLSGPAELYHQNLAKALAHCFQSKFLLLDITDLSLKMHNKYGCPRKESQLKRSISEMALECMSGLSGSPSTGTSRAPSKCTSRVCFGEKLFVESLYKVLVSMSETGSIVLYIKDVEKLFLRSPRIYNLFQKLIKKLSGSVLIVGSRIYDSEDNCPEVDAKLTMVFPYNIEIKPPQDETQLENWKTQLEKSIKKSQLKDNRNHIAEVLATNDIDCDDLNSICHTEIMLLSKYIEDILANAICYNLIDTKYPKYRNGKLIVSSKSLCHVLSLFQEEMKIKELIEEKKKREAGVQNSEVASNGTKDKENKVIALKPSNKKDMRETTSMVAAAAGSITIKLKQGNELHGEGGSRMNKELNYISFGYKNANFDLNLTLFI